MHTLLCIGNENGLKDQAREREKAFGFWFYRFNDYWHLDSLLEFSLVTSINISHDMYAHCLSTFTVIILNDGQWNTYSNEKRADRKKHKLQQIRMTHVYTVYRFYIPKTNATSLSRKLLPRQFYFVKWELKIGIYVEWKWLFAWSETKLSAHSLDSIWLNVRRYT